jgi:hypothetical protein
MNSHERILVAEAQRDALRIENAELRASSASEENAQLKAGALDAAHKIAADRMYVSMIRRRSAALVRKGRQYDAILLLKKIGE